MMTSPTQHLTEEELDDVLIGTGSAEAQQHLATCERCTAQIAPFQSSVAAFNEGSLAWAQAKSNTVSRDLSSARLSTGRTQPMAWGAGVAMIGAIAFALGTGLHRAPATLDANTQARAAQTAATDNAQEIAADNAMLEAIDSEIGTAAPAPLQPFRPTNARIHRNPGSEVRD
jgi:hypothetical protein